MPFVIGLGLGLPFQGGAAASGSGAYTPSFQFDDSRNSQYLAMSGGA